MCPTGERVRPADSVCPIENVLRVGSLKVPVLSKYPARLGLVLNRLDPVDR